MTEPGIGSDLAGDVARARRRDGDHYVVNGAKTFITNGINADLVIVAVKTDPSERHRGISLLVLERGMDGLRARAQPREDRPARAGHRRAVVHRRARARREPARRGGRGLPLPRLEPAPGAPLDRRLGRRRGRGRARLDARLRARAPGLRAADRLVPELALHARGDAHAKSTSRASTSTAARRRSTPAS